MEALRRYVPDWSKNSTLIPIRKEDGDLKYIDFSHANAYDTLVRPLQAVLNNVASGNQDQDGMMDDFMLGVWDATKELGSPFISESIWTEAASDIIQRGGRTREGTEVYNELDTRGDRMSKIMKHLVKSQMPFSWEQLKRLDVAIKPVDIIQDIPGEFDKYGQAYELGDEMLGFMGMRRVDLNPARGLDYKIADYQRGVRNSRRLFTSETLKGGAISPKEIVDAYINANRALFDVRRNMMKDYDAAQILGVSNSTIALASKRLSKRDYGTIRQGIFRPYTVSRDIIGAFGENARAIGVANPYTIAAPVISAIRNILSVAPLSLEFFPELFNPFGEPEEEVPQAKAPVDINTPIVNASLLGKGPNMTNNAELTRTGLTQTENALLSQEEKAIRLRQRGIA